MKIIEKYKENCPSEILFLSLLCFMAGVAVGLLISPAKNGITIGSNNGCNNRITDSNKTKKITDSKIK